MFFGDPSVLPAFVAAAFRPASLLRLPTRSLTGIPQSWFIGSGIFSLRLIQRGHRAPSAVPVCLYQPLPRPPSKQAHASSRRQIQGLGSKNEHFRRAASNSRRINTSVLLDLKSRRMNRSGEKGEGGGPLGPLAQKATVWRRKSTYRMSFRRTTKSSFSRLTKSIEREERLRSVEFHPGDMDLAQIDARRLAAYVLQVLR
jgi:hypothetical protein